MNNRGQTLVVFVLLLPIIFLLIAIVVDLGNLSYTKQKCVNEIKSTIEYGLKHIEEENLKQKLEMLLDTNIDGTYNVEISNQTIRINVKNKQTSIFKNILSKEDYDIDITYMGYIDNDQIKIYKE